MRLPMNFFPLYRLAALAGASLLSTAFSAEKPNVLLICVDDLKPLLGCYGDAKAITPHIDKLASRSTLFERAYCNQAVCSPSRNALMTGLRPDTIGIYDLATNFRVAEPNAVTLSQAFSKAGYETTAYALPENNLPERQNEKSGRGPAIESTDVPDDTYLDGKIGRAIRTERYRLVEWKVPGSAADTAILELYDYQKDPLETKNIAAEDPQTVSALRKILAQYPEAKAQVQGPGSPKAKAKSKKAAAR